MKGPPSYALGLSGFVQRGVTSHLAQQDDMLFLAQTNRKAQGKPKNHMLVVSSAFDT